MTTGEERPGRANQKARTRTAIPIAAARSAGGATA